MNYLGLFMKHVRRSGTQYPGEIKMSVTAKYVWTTKAVTFVVEDYHTYSMLYEIRKGVTKWKEELSFFSLPRLNPKFERICKSYMSEEELKLAQLRSELQ